MCCEIESKILTERRGASSRRREERIVPFGDVPERAIAIWRCVFAVRGRGSAAVI